MNKKKIAQMLLTTTAFSGGMSLAGNSVEATELSYDVRNNKESIMTISDSYAGKVVNVDGNLTVREEAREDSKVIGYLNPEEICEIKAETDEWYRIYFNGNEGYVPKRNVEVLNIGRSVRVAKRGQVIGTGNGLIVRQSPSTSSAKITSLRDGDIFEIISQSGEWYNIRTGSTIGFVYGKYVKVLEEVSPPTTSISKGKVNAISGNLRVRSAPNTNSLTLGYLLAGQEVQIIGEDGDWYKINYNGKTGYSHKQYITKISDSNSGSNNNNNNNNTSEESRGVVIDAPSGLRVRSDASTSSKILGTISNGSTIKITGTKGDWYKISYNSSTGYVHKDYVKITNTQKPPENNKPEVPKNKKGQVYNITSNLRVRSEANVNSSVLGYLLNEEKVDITGESGDWYKIDYKGKVGYASKSYIKLIEETERPVEPEKPVTPPDTSTPEQGGTNENYTKVISVGSVSASSLNVRSGAGENFGIVGKLNINTIVEVVDKSSNGWYKIKHGNTYGYVSSKYIRISTNSSNYSMTLDKYVDLQYPSLNLIHKNGKWVNASKSEIKYNLDPSNFINNSGKYMFMKLNHVDGIPMSVINEVISGRGILSGKGQAFIDGAKKYNVNVMYLLSHARLETGNGTSTLSKGVLVKEVDGKPVTPRIVYNMYGVGAIDSDPLRGGSEYAYKQGWFTPEKAITEGASWISKNYINNSSYGQNTLYKMRWNLSSSGPGWHQYASDIAWAEKQATIMAPYLDKCGVAFDFDIPTFGK
ncbi:SH3 domain-containing protein [Clostridium paraputrificum]|uniref:SH3 domain-containing protein n=1 Tax=Clostridium paraputrificum TaxID=29363 RepID=UPI003D348C6A